MTRVDSNAMPPSNDFSESTGDSRIAQYTDLPTLRQAAWMLLRTYPEKMSQFTALANRLGMTIRGKPYDGYYIKYVWVRKMPYSPALQKAAEKLISELAVDPPDTSGYRTVMVKVPNGVDIPNGAVILRDAIPCICGAFFIPTIWNQINHTTACAKMRAKLRRRK
ncbi:hypothetical protein LCGC14_1991570 [marine sediment metagenome]|uniref:Uncharacterized protein n=1 Tax=marine sediment metagenome TaxID=412755 RepID=A0A0F9F679_9ZZZZ